MLVARALANAWEDVRDVARGRTATHSHVRDRVVAILTVSVVIDVVAAFLILLLERHAAGTKITNFGDAIFWTSTQLLTVSSQLPNPLTPGGRILDVGLQAYAITVVAAMAGLFGAFFHRRGRERDEAAEGRRAA